MRTLNRIVLGLVFTLLAGCGQQLVEFGNGIPTVTSTDPVNLATNVGVSRTVNATFSEQMDPASISAGTFTLKQGSTSIAGSVKYAGMTATFTPASDLSSNTFTATISTAAKSATSGNSLVADYGLSEAGRIAEGMLNSAPLDLRVNLARTRREDVREQLAKDGIDAQPTVHSPSGLRVDGKPPINRHPLFQDGLVEV